MSLKAQPSVQLILALHQWVSTLATHEYHLGVVVVLEAQCPINYINISGLGLFLPRLIPGCIKNWDPPPQAISSAFATLNHLGWLSQVCVSCPNISLESQTHIIHGHCDIPTGFLQRHFNSGCSGVKSNSTTYKCISSTIPVLGSEPIIHEAAEGRKFITVPNTKP